MENLYLIPVEIQNIDCCFKECGKILVGGVEFEGFPCLPCREQNCQYEAETKEVGKGTIAGVEENIILRKLKQEG
jgi:hypothetical protein